MPLWFGGEEREEKRGKGRGEAREIKGKGTNPNKKF